MTYKKKFTNYIFTLLIVLIILVSFSMYVQDLAKAQGTANNIFPENATANINNQFISIVVLFFMGFLVLLPFESKIERNLIMILSFIIGLITYCFISIFLLLCRINLTVLSIFIVYFIVLLVLYIKSFAFDKQKISLTSRKLRCMAFWVVVILASGYVFCKTNFSTLTFDSIQYKTLGNSFGEFNAITPYAHYALVGHSLILALLNTITVLVGFDFAYGIQNLFMLNSIILFGYLIYDYTKTYVIKRPLLTAMIPTALFASSFFVVFLSICHVPNMFAGYFLLFFVIFVEKHIRSNKSTDIVFAFIFAVAFCFSRVEGPLVIAFILAYLAHNKLPTKTILNFTSYLTAILVFYYWTILSFVGTSYESAFLTYDKCILIIMILLAIIIYTKLKDKFFNSKNDLLLKIYLASIFVFSLAMCLMDIPKSIHNISTLYINVFAEGMWLISWFVVIIFACICLVLNDGKPKNKGISQSIIYIYLVLLLTIFAFRSYNLHINWSDSGNRLLMHIYPLIIYSLYNNTIFYLQKKEKRI